MPIIESIENINYLLEQNDPSFFGQPLGLNEDLDELLLIDVVEAQGRAKEMAWFVSSDGKISESVVDGWFSYFYHGERDLYQEEEDIEFVDNDLLDTVEEVIDREFVTMPEIRPSTVDDVEEVPEWFFELAGGEDEYWNHEICEEMEYREIMEKEIFMAEMRDIEERRLPDCRLMTVTPRVGRRCYEYISVRTGRIRYSDKGNWYHEETRYPITEGGEMKPRKRRAVPTDICAIEELTSIGITKDECTTDLLVDICRRQQRRW